MSVVVRYGPFMAFCLLLSCVPAQAQEAEDLSLDSGYADDGTGSFEDLPPPPPPQFASPDDEAVQRRRTRDAGDPFAAQGIRMGAFLLYPQVEIGAMATSNAGSRSDDQEGDVALSVKPALRLESNWSRHHLNIAASAETLRYLSNDDLSTKDASVDANLRLDVRQSLQANLDFGYALSSTTGGDSEVPDTATGNRIDQAWRGGAALTRSGLIEGRVRAGFNRLTYGDVDLSGGGTEDNSDRNYTEFDLSARATFNTAARVQPFVEVAYTPRVHDEKTDRNGFERNSQGFAISAGFQFVDDPVWTGEFAATYLFRHYEDESLGWEQAPGAVANLQWRPTELATVDLSAGVALNETSVADEAARTSWDFGATLTYALRDNIDIYGGGTLGLEEADDGLDRTLGAKAGVIWRANPYFAWSLGYEGTWFSGESSADYDEQRLMASVILQR